MAKLILGTAEFGPKPYGTAIEPLSLNTIRSILECAHHGGINILEGAEAYKCDEALTDLRFDVIYKITHPYNLSRILDNIRRNSLLGLMYHHGYETQSRDLLSDSRVLYQGASIYKVGQLTGRETMIEVPLNLENREFERLTAPCKIVRSVFGRGELLKTHSVKECLEYVKNLPTVQGVIVGVNSVKELEQILEAWK